MDIMQRNGLWIDITGSSGALSRRLPGEEFVLSVTHKEVLCALIREMMHLSESWRDTSSEKL